MRLPARINRHRSVSVALSGILPLARQAYLVIPRETTQRREFKTVTVPGNLPVLLAFGQVAPGNSLVDWLTNNRFP